MKGSKNMRFDCYLSVGCASQDNLKENITKALELESAKAEVNYYRITDEEAVRLRLRGSPSVLLNGKDIQPLSIEGFS